MTAAAIGPVDVRTGISPRRAVAFGLTLGIAVALHEWIDLSAARYEPGFAAAVSARLMFDCCLQYVALSLLLAWRSRRGLLSWRFAGIGWLAFSAAASFEAFLLYHLMPPQGETDILNPWSRVAWIALFYGGIFIVASKFQQNTQHTSRVLAEAELARQHTEGLLEREQMRALQGRIDPALLLRAMSEVRKRYMTDASSTAHLLDALIAFLRAAMPAVRSGDSTLSAELRVARRYAALSAELDPERPRWHFSIDPALPALRFPALWLMPVMDRFEAAQVSAGEPLRLVVRAEADGLVLRMTGGDACAARWIEPELVHRLKVGLRTAFGGGWGLAVDPLPAGLLLRLERPSGEAAPEAASVDSMFNILGERHEQVHPRRIRHRARR